KSSVTVSLSAVDNVGGRGVRFIEYTTTGGGGFRRYTGPFQIVVNGNTQITARATDQAGNVESPAQGTTVRIDTRPPPVGFAVTGTVGSAGWFKSPVNVSVFAGDPQGTGVTSVEYSIGNAAFQPYTAPFSITADGTTTLTARATDANGNVGTT